MLTFSIVIGKDQAKCRVCVFPIPNGIHQLGQKVLVALNYVVSDGLEDTGPVFSTVVFHLSQLLLKLQ